MSPPNYQYTPPNSQYTFTSVYSLCYSLGVYEIIIPRKVYDVENRLLYKTILYSVNIHYDGTDIRLKMVYTS